MDLSIALRRAALRDHPRSHAPRGFRCPDPVRAIGPLDPNYPSALHGPVLRPPPKALFVRGTGPLPSPSRCVALIGARRCTEHGRSIARDLAAGLSRGGIVVVSGLALGIDAAAHAGALDAGGRTLAVLASSVDEPTPRANRRLGEEIVTDGGWLVSERAPAAAVRASEFPRRNRLVVALCSAVIVVEAGLPSGTLGTVALALAAGLEVGVVPGSILSPASRGANALLRAGALPITGVDDALALVGRARAVAALEDPDEAAVLRGAPGASGPATQWLNASGLPHERARSALLRLVAKGALKRDGPGSYARTLR
ncbi:MAG: DNA-processing protein DprA [Deltaproteobacteria bacterium]|nr:DNA-processing protein DprA [Deltaproteobacteria bacterium]